MFPVANHFLGIGLADLRLAIGVLAEAQLILDRCRPGASVVSSASAPDAGHDGRTDQKSATAARVRESRISNMGHPFLLAVAR